MGAGMPRSNVRRLRPTEVSAVADLLAQEHDDLEELAKEVCRTINRMRAEEPHWVRVVQFGSGYLMYGPYRSAEEAREDSLSGAPDGTGEFRLWSLIPPYGQAAEQADAQASSSSTRRRGQAMEQATPK